MKSPGSARSVERDPLTIAATMQTENSTGTAVLTPQQQKAATAVFRRLGRERQFLLVQKVVAERERALRLAYPAVLSVGFGFKTRGSEGRAERNLVRTPCVVFEVARKRKLLPTSRRLIPRFLLERVEEGGALRLCAVPTDVKPSIEFGAPVPHLGDFPISFPHGIAVSGLHEGPDATAGAVACIIRRSSGNERYAVGCRHVLSRSLEDDPDIASGCDVNGATDEWPFVGRTTAIRGAFEDAPKPSFDAQLMRVSQSDGWDTLFAGISFSLQDEFLTGPEKVTNALWVATPRADERGRRVFIGIRFIDWVRLRPMRYMLGGRQQQIAHELAIHGCAVGSALQPGDSGSPAVLTRRGSMLVGMYLGGDGVHAYFIPAWQLLTPGNYGLDEPDWVLET